MDCFRICTQLTDGNNEEKMPQSLCEECGLELKIAWNFQQKAKQSDGILRQAAAGDSTNNGEQINDHQASSIEMRNCGLNEFKNEEPEMLIIKGEVAEVVESNKEDIIISSGKYEIEDLEYYVIEKWEEADTDDGKGVPERFEYETADNSPDEKNVAGLTQEIATTATYSCSNCFQLFETNYALSLHTLQCRTTINEQKEKLNICHICDQTITKGVTLRKHLKDAHSNVIKCNECDYSCPAYQMSKHIENSHGELGSFACNLCDKILVSQSLLKTHIKYHQRKEANIKSDACEICGKRFSTQHYLRQHMDVHRKERQLHHCDHCDKIYVSKIAFDNHSRLHKGETIKCEQCGKQFVRQYELNVHMRFHRRDYPFNCDICDKKFAIKGHLRTHMWRHQGLKLQCEECGKLFTSTKALQEHSFVHSEMPYPCTYCGRGYPSKQKFKVHLKTAHLVEVTEDEILKITKIKSPKPLQRKKLTLVQADSVMKEIEVKDGEEEIGNESELSMALC